MPAPTRPEALRLSGGYVGAKRVIWQMAHNANSVAKERGLDVHFQVLLPLQLVGDTGLGRTVATAYAERDGTTVEDHLVKRYGMPFLPKQYGQEVAEELLTSNAAKPIREQLTLIRMFEQLRERGYEGGYDAVRLPGDGPSSTGQATATAYVPLSFAPGEAYQFDWSHEVVLLNVGPVFFPRRGRPV